MKSSHTPIIISILVGSLLIGGAILYHEMHSNSSEMMNDFFEHHQENTCEKNESCSNERKGDGDMMGNDWGETCSKNEKNESCSSEKNAMENDNIMGMTGSYNKSAQEIFSESTTNLPDVVPTKLVSLKDGDTFKMSAEMVKQKVGNRLIKRLAYNRMIPGPIIQVEKDAEITLQFTNNLDIQTTLHSHGIRLDDNFDGVPEEMGGRQKPMNPGETFAYTLKFPDTGVYWYHPHMREDYTQELGLYGNFSVTEDGYWNKVDREEFLVLDDFSENDPFYKDLTNKTLMGRFGNIIFINNQENFIMKAKTGEKIRFYITNTANTRTFDFSLDGQKLKIVGGDIGRGEKEFLADNFIIAPAERIIFEAEFSKAGTFAIQNRGKKIGEIIVTGADVATKSISLLKENKADYAFIRKNFQKFLNQKTDKKLRLSLSMKGTSGMSAGTFMGMMGEEERGMGTMMGENGAKHEEDGGIEWEDTMPAMNDMTNNEMMEWKLIDETDSQNPKTNIAMNENWKFQKGDMVKIEIFNDPKSIHPMQHPIHFHGQRFVVLTRDGVPNENLQWKDTVLVQTGEKIEILVEMSNPGKWIAHCHIAEHMHAGMMFNFEVR